MESLLEAKEPKEPPRVSGRAVIALVAGLVVLLGISIALFVQLRTVRSEMQTRLQEVGDRVAQVDQRAGEAGQRAAELDLALAGVRAQAKAVADRVGVTEKDLARAEVIARQIRQEQRQGLDALGGQVGQVRQDLETNRTAIEQTQDQLKRTIGDLGEQSGLIARNHEELAQLKQNAAREYFEFDLHKAKRPAPLGPVAMRLKSTDVKHNRYTLLLMVDDNEIEKKDKTLLEPVQFYRRNARQLHEIVVYTIGKDRIVGYLSTPKAAAAAQ